jgi:hypothetical protein
MNKIQLIIIGAIIAVILFAGGIFVGKYKFSTHEIKIEEKIEYKTIWKEKPALDMPFTQENFNNLLYCATADLHFQEKTENDYLYVTASDGCKENTARYKIGQKGNWKIYFGIAGVAAITGGVIAYKYFRR